MIENVQMGVIAYVDGELRPEEAAEVEAQLEKASHARANFDAFSLQRVQLGEAADTFDARTQNTETARLVRYLVSALHRRRAR